MENNKPGLSLSERSYLPPSKTLNLANTNYAAPTNSTDTVTESRLFSGNEIQSIFFGFFGFRWYSR